MSPPRNSYNAGAAESEVVSLEQASKIPGTTSPECKLTIATALKVLSRGFGGFMAGNSTIVEVSVNPKSADAAKMEGRVVCELVVNDDMHNPSGSIHGGATAWIIDVFSTLALIAFNHHNKADSLNHVSQAINILYHGPAVTGDKLRIISTTISAGARVQSVSCEVWNVTRHRLVATGTHAKMKPSASKL